MSSLGEGLIGYFKKAQPNIVYQNCASHRLNLAIGKGCDLFDISQLFENINNFSVIVKDSPKRMAKWREIVEFCNRTYKDIGLNDVPIVPGGIRWLGKQTSLNSVTKSESSFICMYKILYLMNTEKDLKPDNDKVFIQVKASLSYWSVSISTHA